MANNPYVNKVVYGGVTLIDTSGVTVTADKLAKGYTALDSSGALIVGTANLGGETVWYGKCLTSSGVQTKTVTISGITELYEGLSVRINFVNGQDFDGIPMLNINSLGAKIVIRNANTGAAQYEWADGEVLDFVYDGNYWVIVNGGNIKIGGSGSLLPSEYTQVEYIGAENANPYINTGLYMTGEVELEIHYYNNKTEAFVFGARKGMSTTPYCNFNIEGSGGKSRFDYGSIKGNNARYFDNIHDGEYWFTFHNRIATITSALTGQVNTSDFTDATFQQYTDGSICLFANNTNGAPSVGAVEGALRIYGAKIWIGGVLAGEFVPCVRKSDDEPGMYDLVTETFFTNAGNDAFSVPS